MQNKSKPSRRDVLEMAGAAGMAASGGRLLVRAFGPDGAPASEALLSSLLLVNRDSRPFELLPEVHGMGAASIGIPRQEFEWCMLLPVRGFGQVYVYADNAGQRYTGGGELIANYECARSRASFVRRYVRAAQAEGVEFSRQTLQRLERGEAALQRAKSAHSIAEKVGHSNDSLAETMWAGDMAALERARRRIARQGLRPGFLFGSNAFRLAEFEEYRRHFLEGLNFATLPFYHRETERREGAVDYSRPRAILDKLSGTGVTPKAHPLMFFHEQINLPPFLKGRSWDEVRAKCREYIWRTIREHRSRIHVWEIINEAHDWANALNFSQEQLVEMTRLAADATQAADPTGFRVVNSCNIWGEYVARRRNTSGPSNRSLWTPLEYFHSISDARVSYEAVGLQVYNPSRDMLEIERQIERFCALGKRVHITELGVPSSSSLDPAGALRPPSPGIAWVSKNVWHGTEWTEENQADWVEYFYTICYSKPQIDAISWWSFSDPAAHPFCGLLRRSLQPKKAYERLKKLISEWRS